MSFNDSYGDYFGEALDYAKPDKATGTLKQRKAEELNGLLAAAEILERRISKVTSQLAVLNSFAEVDPYVNGVTLKFDRNFPNGDQVYSYRATKLNDKWYLTGARAPQGVTWDEFVSWLGLGLVGELEVIDLGASPTKATTPRKRAPRRVTQTP